MKTKWVITSVLALVALLLPAVSCLAPTSAIKPPVSSTETTKFNMIFQYGITLRNELNTYKGTFTKDMIVETPITISLTLTGEELDKIYAKMLEIGFFDYPDEFSVTVPPGQPTGMRTPCSNYYFKVEYDSGVKELSWADCITNKDEKADKLRELIALIISIIESKEEYKKLPPARGGYL